MIGRRGLVSGLALLLPASLTGAAAGQKACVTTNRRDSVTWTVPQGIKRIKVRSWSKDGSEVIDTHFRVQPGQVFQIDVARDS